MSSLESSDRRGAKEGRSPLFKKNREVGKWVAIHQVGKVIHYIIGFGSIAPYERRHSL